MRSMRLRPVALGFLYRLVGRVVQLVGIHRMDAVAKDTETSCCATS